MLKYNGNIPVKPYLPLNAEKPCTGIRERLEDFRYSVGGSYSLKHKTSTY